MNVKTRGSEAFDALCRKHERPSRFMVDLAQTYGVTTTTLYRWRTGATPPSFERMKRLRSDFDIPIGWWAEQVVSEGAAA